MIPRSNNILYFLVVCFIFVVFSMFGSAERVRLFSLERPVVLYYNRKYLEYLNVTAHRQGRKNPVYYSSMHLQSKVAMDNNVTVSFYLYAYSGNQRYHRSFIDLHFKLCDLIEKDQFVGPMLRQGKLLKPCPYPADDYHLTNMSLRQEAIPNFVPLSKGRVYTNVTATETGELISSGYCDIEIREIYNYEKQHHIIY